MCKMVGADFKKINFKKESWFYEYEWTEWQEQFFIGWMVGYLMHKKEARQEMMRFPRKNIKDLTKLATEFIMNYGWKVKKTKESDLKKCPKCNKKFVRDIDSITNKKSMYCYKANCKCLNQDLRYCSG